MPFVPRALRPNSTSPDDAAIYDYSATTADITLAVDVAVATHRPLLVRGPPGCGKTLLAANVAMQFGVECLTEVITSRTEAADLLWRFDALRRLRDAQAQQTVEDLGAYIEPGVLWKAFDPATATSYPRRAQEHPRPKRRAKSEDPQAPTSVVLLDEMDKAEPEVPDALLDVLGRRRFRVPELARDVECQGRGPLIFITTNEERPLSRPFLRRCVVLGLQHPDEAGLVRIATAHFGAERPIFRAIAGRIVELRRTLRDRPSTAEFLDAIRACDELRISLTDARWEWVERLVLLKDGNG